jgi:hypothetical protein
MMFLNWECPAMAKLSVFGSTAQLARAIGQPVEMV